MVKVWMSAHTGRFIGGRAVLSSNHVIIVIVIVLIKNNNIIKYLY